MSKGARYFLFSVLFLVILGVVGIIFLPTMRKFSADEAYRQYISDPVPGSVTKLEGSGSSNLTGGGTLLTFYIAPADLDRILQERKFNKTDHFVLMESPLATQSSYALPNFELYE